MADSLQLEIDLASPIPVYRQIQEAIRLFLVEGRLKSGDSLPSVRELALELGVHHNTVAEAYRMLAEEGWLELKRRLGARVVSRATPLAGLETRDRLRQRLRGLVAQMRAEGISCEDIRTELLNVAEGLHV